MTHVVKPCILSTPILTLIYIDDVFMTVVIFVAAIFSVFAQLLMRAEKKAQWQNQLSTAIVSDNCLIFNYPHNKGSCCAVTVLSALGSPEG